jgi:predicted DCC family thiol-disulfide oxidoreductase YuxK
MTEQEDPRMPTTAQECTLIYDADCRLCVGAKNRIEKAAAYDTHAKVRFLPYRSEEAARRLSWSRRTEESNRDWMLFFRSYRALRAGSYCIASYACSG